ncbi:unnamed protein product [Effrenium voratum]|nr:unnamed protein product [Effrenium voratum]
MCCCGCWRFQVHPDTEEAAAAIRRLLRPKAAAQVLPEEHLAQAAAGARLCLEAPGARDSELPEVALHCLAAVRSAAEAWGFCVEEPFLQASRKVRRRTPYMAWGDGSGAKTAQEAKEHWIQAKAREKSPGLTSPSHGVERRGGVIALVWVVEHLVAECPWTMAMDLGKVMTFLQEECAEAQEELSQLRAGIAARVFFNRVTL